ncbi:Actin-binding protein IPP [Zancudomyces culisetae]|uniref:Actin-binding protein IPP n=1 Tax=Zancudomyces culisetae TaxID=1213189 RepID=A0A1R1PR72_ZANCU|nr:Actin-binding protein IPP [Zancudomyces culisetae]|eukprot:OMH83454.1 Actin-binding protein IPP [Zancudomyces culisetae]
MGVSSFSVRSEVDEPKVKEPSSWTQKMTKLSLPRSRLAAASAGNKVVFAGGILDNMKSTKLVDIYNTESSQWSTAGLVEARSEIGVGSFLNARYAIFAGGVNDNSKESDAIDIYDGVKDEWLSFKLRYPRINPRVLDLGDSIAIYGGIKLTPPYISDKIEYIIQDENKFIIDGEETIEMDRLSFGVGISNPVKKMAVVVGGYQNNSPEDKHSDFQPSNYTVFLKETVAQTISVSLSNGEPLPAPRWRINGAFAFGNYVFGGGESYDADNNVQLEKTINVLGEVRRGEYKWIDVKAELSVPRASAYAGALENYILFCGGSSLDTIDIFDTRSLKIVEENKLKMKEPREDAGYTTNNGCLMIIGGGTLKNNVLTDSVEIIDACG